MATEIQIHTVENKIKTIQKLAKESLHLARLGQNVKSYKLQFNIIFLFKAIPGKMH